MEEKAFAQKNSRRNPRGRGCPSPGDEAPNSLAVGRETLGAPSPGLLPRPGSPEQRKISKQTHTHKFLYQTTIRAKNNYDTSIWKA